MPEYYQNYLMIVNLILNNKHVNLNTINSTIHLIVSLNVKSFYLSVVSLLILFVFSNERNRPCNYLFKHTCSCGLLREKIYKLSPGKFLISPRIPGIKEGAIFI